jgi:hypothetical protein
VWQEAATLPDHQLIVFARDDDYTFGVLHSHVHELWALQQGTQLETRPRYTPTSTFETFPFPEPTKEQRQEIADAAKNLDFLREGWLGDPEGADRTLTNLYNAPPTWLRHAHGRLDRAVLEAYGLPSDTTDLQVLQVLLKVNADRAQMAFLPGGKPGS